MKWFIKAMSQYADFDGRARRREFWWFIFFVNLFSFILAYLSAFIWLVGSDGSKTFNSLLQLAVFIPGLSVSVRRMHDTDHSGFWVLVPFANLYFCLKDGTQGDNSYGHDPKV